MEAEQTDFDQTFLEMFTTKHESLCKEKENSDLELQMMENQLSRNEHDLEVKRNIINDQRMQVEQLSQKSEVEHRYRTKQNSNIDDTKKEIAIFHEYYEQIKNSIDIQVSICESQKICNKERQNETESLKKRLDIKTERNHNEVNKLEGVLSNLEKEDEHLQMKFEVTLKGKTEKLNKVEEEQKLLQESESNIEKKISMLSSEFQGLMGETDELFCNYTKLNETVSLLSKEYDSKKLDFNNDIITFQLENERNKNSIEMLVNEVESFRTAVGNQTEYINELKTKNDTLEFTTLDLKQSFRQSEYNLSELKQTLEQEQQTQAETLVNSNSNLLKLEQDNQKICEESADLEQNLTNIEEIIENDKNILNEINEVLANEQQNADEIQLILKEAKEMLEQLRSEFEELRAKEEKERQDTEKYETNLSEEIKRVDEEKSMILGDFEDFQNTVAEQESESTSKLKDINIEIENLELEMEEVKKEAKKCEAMYDGKLKQATDAEYKKLKGITEQFEKYKEETEHILQNEKKKFMEEREKLNKTLSNTEQQLNEFKRSKADLEDNMQNRALLIAELSKEKESLEVKIQEGNQYQKMLYDIYIKKGLPEIHAQTKQNKPILKANFTLAEPSSDSSYSAGPDLTKPKSYLKRKSDIKRYYGVSSDSGSSINHKKTVDNEALQRQQEYRRQLKRRRNTIRKEVY